MDQENLLPLNSKGEIEQGMRDKNWTAEEKLKFPFFLTHFFSIPSHFLIFLSPSQSFDKNTLSIIAVFWTQFFEPFTLFLLHSPFFFFLPFSKASAINSIIMIRKKERESNREWNWMRATWFTDSMEWKNFFAHLGELTKREWINSEYFAIRNEWQKDIGQTWSVFRIRNPQEQHSCWLSDKISCSYFPSYLTLSFSIKIVHIQTYLK